MLKVALPAKKCKPKFLQSTGSFKQFARVQKCARGRTNRQTERAAREHKMCLRRAAVKHGL
jgi:hypothetical protein